MKLTDMAMTEAERQSRNQGEPMGMLDEPYPYGLSITLTEEDLQKLGVDLEAGQVVTIEAAGFVRRDEASSSTGEAARRCATVQITGLAIVAKPATKSPGERVYG